MKFTKFLITSFCITLYGISSLSQAAEPIQVASVERPPFSYLEDRLQQGFSIELREEIAKELNFRSSYTQYPTFSTMLKATQAGKADIAVANISITSEREEYLDFSHPIYDSGLQFIAKKKVKRKFFIRAKVLGLIVTMILLFVLLQYIAKNKYATAIRTIGVLLIIGCIARLHHARHNYDQYIGNYKDITNERIGTSIDTTMSSFLDKKAIPYQAYDDLSQAITALEAGELDYVLSDAAIAQYQVYKQVSDTLVLVGQIFNKDKLAFAFPEDSELVESVNNILLQMREDGRYDSIKKRFF